MTALAEETYRRVMTVDPPKVTSPFEQATRDFVFGQVWCRPGLNIRDRRLVTLSCVCAADATGPIEEHIYAALASGDLTLDELGEFALHFAVYCGWPKASHVDTVIRTQWLRIHEERGEAPPEFPTLPTGDLVPADPEERLKGGERHFRDVNYWPAPARETPYNHAGILNFVFGHVWQRPKLGQRDRRLVTLGCVGVSDTLGPLESHIGTALRSRDVSYDEMKELILQFSAYSGFAKGQAMSEIAAQKWDRIQLDGLQA